MGTDHKAVYMTRQVQVIVEHSEQSGERQVNLVLHSFQLQKLSVVEDGIALGSELSFDGKPFILSNQAHLVHVIYT